MLGSTKRYRRPRRSLLEKLVFTAACAVVLGYVSWSVNALEEETRIKQALLDVSRIQHAARLFRADHGRCPIDMDELVTPPGEHRYLRSAVDPWGQAYRLTCPSRSDPGGVDVASGGPDGSFAGNDTISSL